jgi:tRNA nucleotidyltransferase (CCA-adding enzyme)
MRSLNIPPGQQIGKLLLEIQLAQAEGKISTREEALALAAHII